MLGAFRPPVHRQQALNVAIERRRQALQDIGQVGQRIVAVGLGGFYQTGDDGAGFAAALAAGEQPVLAAYGDFSQGALGGVVVDGDGDGDGAIVEVLDVFASGLRFRLLFGPGRAFSRLPENAFLMPPAKLTAFAIAAWLGYRWRSEKKGPTKGRRVELISAGVP